MYIFSKDIIYEHPNILITSLGRSSEELEKTNSVLGSVMIRKTKAGKGEHEGRT
jgi:hypothetical protein